MANNKALGHIQKLGLPLLSARVGKGTTAILENLKVRGEGTSKRASVGDGL